MNSSMNNKDTASLQERFAAFLLDSFLFFHLFGACLLLFRFLMREDLTRPLSYSKSEGLMIGTMGAALYFLYYLFFEGVLAATPGKILAGLHIQKISGGVPSLFSVFLRNFFRLMDYPLFPLTSIGLMESTQHHLRLGDWIARTVVARKVSPEEDKIPAEPFRYASSTQRGLAFLLDLVLFLAFSYGLLLTLPVNRTLISFIGLNLLPAAILLWMPLSEKIFGTSFGKAVFGMKVLAEDGREASFATLFLRNLFLILDLSPIGYLLIFLSIRKQRLGDVAAGTIVVRHPRGLRGWLSIPILLALSLSLGYLGYINPQSCARQGTRIELGNYLFGPFPLGP